VGAEERHGNKIQSAGRKGYFTKGKKKKGGGIFQLLGPESGSPEPGDGGRNQAPPRGHFKRWGKKKGVENPAPNARARGNRGPEFSSLGIEKTSEGGTEYRNGQLEGKKERAVTLIAATVPTI